MLHNFVALRHQEMLTTSIKIKCITKYNGKNERFNWIHIKLGQKLHFFAFEWGKTLSFWSSSITYVNVTEHEFEFFSLSALCARRMPYSKLDLANMLNSFLFFHISTKNCLLKYIIFGFGNLWSSKRNLKTIPDSHSLLSQY